MQIFSVSILFQIRFACEMSGKKISVKVVHNSKYGIDHSGVFTDEPILKDEQVLTFEWETWPFYEEDDLRGKCTKEELLALTEDKPQLKKFFMDQAYYIGDGRYNLPTKFLNDDFSNIEEYLQNLPQHMLLNHSCDPNLYLVENVCFAQRDIAAGEELTMDYNTVDDENSLRYGMVCMCGSGDKCVKILRMDKFRDPDWVKANYSSCSPYLTKRIEELRKNGELL